MSRRTWAILLPCVVLLFPVAALAQSKCHRTWTPAQMQHVNDVSSRLDDAITKNHIRQGIVLGKELCRLDDNPADRCNLACLYVRAGRFSDAMRTLREAVACGPHDPSFLLDEELNEDHDLDPLRTRQDFQALTRRAEAVQWKPVRLEYENSPVKPAPFARSQPDNPYLADLAARYNLNALIAGARGDMERVEILCTWVHTRWNHVGDAKNQPKDPIGLLEAAKAGDNFRCVEYGITVAGCLNAVGIPARVVSAMAKDTETRRSSAGHVFAEAYLRDQKQWVFVDPQTNVVGEADGKPLNTVEFQQAFSGPHPKVHYDRQLGSCFCYFNYGLDWRYPIADRKPGSIMLAPQGASAPRVFQRIYPVSATRVTHTLADVYGPPPSAQ